MESGEDTYVEKNEQECARWSLGEGHSWLKSCKDRKESPHTEQTEQAIRSACAQSRRERGWERGRYVSTTELAGHAPEFRPPPARKHDVIRCMLTDSSGSNAESGLEVIRLGAKKQIKNVYNCPVKKRWAQWNIISP